MDYISSEYLKFLLVYKKFDKWLFLYIKYAKHLCIIIQEMQVIFLTTAVCCSDDKVWCRDGIIGSGTRCSHPEVEEMQWYDGLMIKIYFWLL